jgi:oligopeptide/dipeptide ABC transporter ATP-binding protein
MNQPKEMLSVQGMSVEFPTLRGVVNAVTDVSFSLHAGETLSIVGESGCGKSTVAMSILGLLAMKSRCRISGHVLLEGNDLTAMSQHQMRKVRGNGIGMIFQDPMMALNPVFTVGWQIDESLKLHLGLSTAAARRRSIELLDLVGIPSPSERYDQYPHNLSGGMRQRVMIAMALACQPKVLIADEPTTALDVTIQAQVLALINRLKKEMGMAVLLITHDLGVVWEVADRVAVMYAGRKVEEADVDDLFHAPAHPYTQGLLRAASWRNDSSGRLSEIGGTVPSPLAMPPGCSFAPRCSRATAKCATKPPPLVGTVRQFACYHPEPAAA